MVLRLSDLVKKSIDKGYGISNQPIEKPWAQGNLSMMDLKTGNNPFVKNIPQPPSPSIQQAAPLQPARELVQEEQPVPQHIPAPASTMHLKQPNDHHASSANPQRSSSRPSASDNKWWEDIIFSDSSHSKTRAGRLLVNHALLAEMED